MLAAAALAAGCATMDRPGAGIIDTHTHFYDPSRPEGVPWPDKNDPVLYRTVLPAEYIALAQPLGIGSTVVVEASPRVADNDWLLALAAREPFLAGLVGHLKPGAPGFAADLARLAANRKFKGIRTGGWDIPVAPEKTEFVKDLARLAEHDLSLDVLGGPDQLPAIVRLARALPTLRIVINHCAGVRIDGGAPDPAWVSNVQASGRLPNLFMKASALPENTGRTGNIPADPEFYRPVLDALWNAFGEDRLIFGSNWPVSARFATLSQIMGIVRPCFQSHGMRAAQKYFRENARRVYRLA